MVAMNILQLSFVGMMIPLACDAHFFSASCDSPLVILAPKKCTTCGKRPCHYNGKQYFCSQRWVCGPGCECYCQLTKVTNECNNEFSCHYQGQVFKHDTAHCIGPNCGCRVHCKLAKVQVICD